MKFFSDPFVGIMNTHIGYSIPMFLGLVIEIGATMGKLSVIKETFQNFCSICNGLVLFTFIDGARCARIRQCVRNGGHGVVG